MTEQKRKYRPRFWIGLGILAMLIFIVAAIIINLPKPQHVSDSHFNLTALADGTYEGECDNGLVYVKVEVEILNHAIVEVHILEHDNGMGQPAEVITQTVVGSQSVEVDTVSGATMSSQTILKAIENALSK